MTDGPDIVVNGAGRDRDQDDLTLIVGGTEITGWQEIEVTLRAEGFPNSFHIALSSKEPISSIVRAGEICTVLLGRDKVITGYIDRDVPGGTPNTHVINVLGRGLTQDLVDCSAEWPQGQLTQADALTIASTLALPYSIGVELGEGAAAGDKVPQWNLNYGETGAEIIQRVARNAGLLAYENAQGHLLLTTVGATRAASGIVYGQNVERWSVDNATDQRFSEIVCCASSMNVLQDLGGNDFYHTERDPNVARHRLMYMVLESVADDPQGFTIRKAQWEIARRAGRSTIVSATIDSWRDAAGDLWMPNTIVPVELPARLPASDLVVAEVTFRRSSESGTTAELRLMPREAFVPEPITLNPISTADIDAVEPAP
ncbi:phage baseplate assembly protein [Sphingomonas sp. Leaf25]|uniref:phage baseplate assembly protein n=1 Tax=Sphingomonas sp. Leaf25 TaxID=1735692 RepID=UPI0006F98FFC|nr:hypothetical protein [Sphingomonas sp. Leaf25]KQN00573.1 hypothetical protein ASE78_05670 [Sphingomonas sp. Leaf25]